MSWSTKYLDIPFIKGGRDFSGLDCGGLVLLVLKEECGVAAKDFGSPYVCNWNVGKIGLNVTATCIESVIDEWIIVEKPKEFDLVRFKIGRIPSHVGVMVKYPYFLHVTEDLGYTKISDVRNNADWGKRFFEYRRHKALMNDK